MGFLFSVLFAFLAQQANCAFPPVDRQTLPQRSDSLKQLVLADGPTRTRSRSLSHLRVRETLGRSKMSLTEGPPAHVPFHSYHSKPLQSSPHSKIQTAHPSTTPLLAF